MGEQPHLVVTPWAQARAMFCVREADDNAYTNACSLLPATQSQVLKHKQGRFVKLSCGNGKNKM